MNSKMVCLVILRLSLKSRTGVLSYKKKGGGVHLSEIEVLNNNTTYLVWPRSSSLSSPLRPLRPILHGIAWEHKHEHKHNHVGGQTSGYETKREAPRSKLRNSAHGATQFVERWRQRSHPGASIHTHVISLPLTAQRRLPTLAYYRSRARPSTPYLLDGRTRMYATPELAVSSLQPLDLY
ncbi:hypothetical protein BDY19DRAFT_977782 [Irpex rosettiformis]|uniref:Uncharacterized protein n=1 Tax=Irpex rosettiformis TaxID=378272 RepID=A0ACB8TNE3_9APHY|nr:hypothetical protein BDY19DRAFT_977782 [Irpex rosettiformis]